MILISSKFSMNFCKISQNAAILKIINISKIATVDLQQITRSFFQAQEFKEKCDTILHPPFKDLKDLRRMLQQD